VPGHNGTVPCEPLTTTVLNQLDFTPFTEEILDKLESERGQSKMEERLARQQIKKLKEEIGKWQSLLPCCVDSLTGQVDREKEDFYWGQKREAQQKLEDIKIRPVPRNATTIDFNKVRKFLKGLTNNWHTYSLASRNQLLKLIIESVELRGSQDIEATIIWKMGYRQKVTIHRPLSNSTLERRWTEEEDRLLRMLFPSAPTDIIMATLNDRTQKAIRLRAWRLGLTREKNKLNHGKKWTAEEDSQLEQYCRDGLPYKEVSDKLDRPADSIATRVRNRHLDGSRPSGRSITWESSELISLQ
jgi:hypothetical protein